MSTTITSLLNSLQSHLQSQTQLLPTLHTQLGLPPTALADDLSTLQRQLTECVESQVNARRAQVDEWMERCDAVQNACVRYGRALGGHVKATGSCVGEIGREGVLPRRFEMITEYQEKLRQLYHTKLEQLLTLTNRIAVLSRTLGPDFYSLDILDPVIAEGEDELEPDAHRDVTPERFSKLEKELVRGKAEVGKRLHQLSLTLVQIDYLYSELGITPPSPDDPSSSTPTSTFNSMLAASSHTNTNTNGMLTASSNDPFTSSIRASTPTPVTRGKSSLLLSGASTPLYPSEENERDEREYQAIFARFVMRLEELGEDAVTDPSKPSVGLETVSPSPGLLSWATHTQHTLSTLKRTHESLIQQTYDLLEPLWRRLSIPDSSIDAFVESHRGSTEETVRAYESELERMMEMKRERMGVFVGGAREEIRGLWEELMCGEGERGFAGMDDDEHTEDLLAQHEQEILRLKEERRLKGHLLTHIRKYFDICEEQKELAAAAADTTRLLGRGPRDPGRLLREEKMRRRVVKEKPRLEQDLLASIPAWEAQTGRPFLVHGQPILEIITANIQASNPPHPEKENGKGKGSGRAGSAPPRSATSQSNHPSTANSNHHPTAGPSKARPASSMSMGGSRQGTGMGGKRKLNESTNSQPSTQRPGLRSASKPSSTSSTTPSLQRAPRSVGATMTTRSIAATPRTTRSTTTGGMGAGGGVGRAPSSTTRRNYHPYPQTQRSTRSATKGANYNTTGSSGYGTGSSAASSSFAVMGSMALNTNMSQPTTKKVVQRTKRESFKPRASVDVWDLPPVPTIGAASNADGRWAGFAGVGVVKEEEFEDDF